MTGIYSENNFDWKKQQSPILSHVQLQGITFVYQTSNLTAHQTSSEGWHFSSSLFGLSTSLPSTLNLGMLGSWHPSLKLLHIFLYLLIIPLHHVENPFSPFLCHFSQVVPSVSPSPGVWHCCTTSHSSITDFVKLKHSSVPPFGKRYILIMQLVLVTMRLAWKHCLPSCQYARSSYWFASPPSYQFSSHPSLQPSVY